MDSKLMLKLRLYLTENTDVSVQQGMFFICSQVL